MTEPVSVNVEGLKTTAQDREYARRDLTSLSWVETQDFLDDILGDIDTLLTALAAKDAEIAWHQEATRLADVRGEAFLKRAQTAEAELAKAREVTDEMAWAAALEIYEWTDLRGGAENLKEEANEVIQHYLDTGRAALTAALAGGRADG